MYRRRISTLFLGLILFLLFFPFLGYCQPPPSQVQISVSAVVPSPGEEEEEEEEEAPPGGGGGGGAPPPAVAEVIFKGRAYPSAFVTILRNGNVAATFQAKKTGLFEKKLTGIPEGVYDFGIFAEDTEGRKSVTLSFKVSILGERTTTISGIFISPTFSLTPTQVERGDKINFSGQSFPESQINIFVSSPKEIVKKTSADKKGKWSYNMDTAFLEEAEHTARVKSIYEDGEQSPFSQTLSFLVVAPGALVCKGADLNFDGKVNLIDFSILLYFWGQSRPSNRCADINFDGIVDLVDFSIMMYWWTD